MKRRRLVKAADMASDQVILRLRKEEPSKLLQRSRDAAIVLDSDDEAVPQQSASDDDEDVPLRLNMHADLNRGARRA